jgi:ABC-type transporter Mla subunit MlaD
MLNTLMKASVCALLTALTIVALQVNLVLAQFGEMASATQQELAQTTAEAQAALVDSQAVLASIRGTTETVRKSAVEQMGYYEAVGRRSAEAIARLELLIAHTDTRLERMTGALEQASSHASESLDQVGALATSMSGDLDGVAQKSGDLIDQTATTVSQLDRRLADRRIDQITTSLSEASQHTAQATANVAEATGYIRDMLSPARKSFWRRLLELMIPRPTVRVN